MNVTGLRENLTDVAGHFLSDFNKKHLSHKAVVHIYFLSEIISE